MPEVNCPYCDNEFEWTREMGEGRVECPMCGKTMVLKVSSASRKSAAPQPRKMTAWGTEGFKHEETKQEYGQIKKGDVLGGFRVEEMIGAGAMAVVYEATQLSLGRPVALKILPQEFARKESFVRQFDSETDLLASLNHPNIVTIIDRGRVADTYYFAMELVDGVTLGELVTTGKIDEDFFLQIMEQCAEALDYAHSKGIIHRDIKPANIMLNEQGMVKVADFGVAGLMARGGEVGGKRKVVGTRGYMPPEQEVHINRTDARSDIFSLGAVMYRILTAKIPDRLPPRPPSKINGEIDRRLDHIVLKCLQASPDRRYQTAKELLEALQSYHRELTKAHEVCPNCKKENPPSQLTCLHCGADLSELFDECPECGALNRMDMDLCMGCGVSLSHLRQETSVAISRNEERARDYAARHRYELAVGELEEVVKVKGKVFQKARDKARQLIAEYRRAEDDYHHQRVEEARRLASDGKLTRAIEMLQAVPGQYARDHGLASLITDFKSRMDLAERKIKSIPDLLDSRRYGDAERALAHVEKVWPNCPGLDEARTQVKAGRDAQRMLEYELTQVRKLLQEGKVTEAREAIQFAQSAMSDHPAVRELLEQIDLRERHAAALGAVRRGREAFDAGQFAVAVRLWQMALDQIPESSDRHKKLQESIAVARRKLLDSGTVRLNEATPVMLSPGRGPMANVLISLGICVGVALSLFAVVMVLLAVAT